MIEVGRESRLSWAMRRLADALGGMAGFLVLVWLIRGLIGIQQYSVEILTTTFGLIFLGRVFSTKMGVGLGSAVSSFLWNLAAGSIFVIVLIWFLGWVATIQSDPFPGSISSRVPSLVIGAIGTGLGAYLVNKLTPAGSPARASRPVFVVPGGKGPSMEGTSLFVKRDTVSMPIRLEGRTVGCVLLGDVSTSFETPMGKVNASLAGPVTTIGIPFQGEKAGKGDIVKMAGKTPKQLVDDTRAGIMVTGPLNHSERVDLPCVPETVVDFEEDVEFGPVKLHYVQNGKRMKFGPCTIGPGAERNLRKRWLAKGIGDSYIKTAEGRVSAKWNGSSLSVEGGSMKLTVGSDSFSYSPSEVRTTSPLHSLSVTQDKITLDTRKFTLKVAGDIVTLRTEEKTNGTESKALSSDLRALLTETVKKQVGDVMEGSPIDLSEMLNGTEELLKKYA